VLGLKKKKGRARKGDWDGKAKAQSRLEIRAWVGGVIPVGVTVG